MDRVRIREATEDDTTDVFQWRNDPETREMSRHTDEVSWDQHEKWFKASLRKGKRLLLICEDAANGEKIGIVRFDIAGDAAEISINLSPAKRGQGYAKPCLATAVGHLSSVFPSVCTVLAMVKPMNVGSRKSFEGAGFVFIKSTDDMNLFERKTG